MKLKIVKGLLSAVILLITCMLHKSDAQNAPIKKYNILFIAVDDLKPDLNCYGFSETITPNIDKLAQKATKFTSAYCQQAVCGPTRASLLTGVRPDKTQVWDLQTLIRDKNPDIVTLPQFFKQNGYKTMGTGKIFDPRSVDKQLDSASWTVPFKKKFKLAEGYENIAFESYQNPEIKAKAKGGEKHGGEDLFEANLKEGIKVTTECLDVPDDAYMDGAMANYAVKQLKQLKDGNDPFFFAIGFKKPHLPFVAPKKYWDLYDRNKIKLAEWQKKSINGPDIAYHNAGELRSYTDIIPANETGAKKNDVLKLQDDKQRELIHGYYACISYMDAQIGKIMEALKKNGLDKNTIIVLWGDHGWHLGDHSLWCKHSNFEQATRVPLIISVPDMKTVSEYAQPVEFVDVYPTICELAGLPLGKYLDGKSLVPAMKDKNVKIKDFSISQYPRGAGKGAREFMGYSLRNKQYRFTEWIGNNFTTAQKFDPTKIKAIELYDMVNDPQETKNIAEDPAFKKVVDELSAQLHAYYEQQYQTAGIVK